MDRRNTISKLQANKFIITGILLGIAYWFLEAAVHASVFGQGDLLSQLLRPDTHELWSRLMGGVVLVSAGVCTQLLIRRYQRAEAALRASEQMLRVKLDFITSTELDAPAIALADIIDLGHLQRIQDGFADATGVASIITDVEGNPITRASNFCRVCDLVRATEEGNRRCVRSDKLRGEKARRLMRPTYQKCLSCGFVDASAPIVVAGKHIANWLIGQTNAMGVDRQRIIEYAREIGADVDQMAAAFESTPQIPLERFEQILDLLWLLAQEISTLGYNNLQMARGVYEQGLTEAALRRSEALLRATVEATADGILVVGNDGKVTYSNRRFADMWRIRNELLVEGEDQRLLEHVLDQLIDPDAFVEKVQQLYQSTEEDFDTLHFKDGRVFERFSCPLLRDGQVYGRVWSFRDMSERQRAEIALKESEARFQELFDSILEGISIVDENEILRFCNPACARMFDFDQPEQLVGRCVLDFVADEHRNRFASQTELRHENKSSQYELTIHTEKDNYKTLLLSVLPRFDSEGVYRGAFAAMTDISARKQTERERERLAEELKRAERMESLGVLAGGVAHDLNNMLGPLVGYPELILRKLTDDSPIRKQVKVIGKAARDAADVIQDLLTLARRGRCEMSPISLNDVVEEYLDSPNFARMIGEHSEVTVSVQLDEDLPAIMGSFPHLSKVVMNLIVNAFDAMPEGGKLTIETSQKSLKRLLGGHSGVVPGEYILLRVKDTGSGIDKGDLDKIFEPYYTKKKLGASGSGLGLAVVYGTVKDHKGYYDIFSKKGRGAEFVLYFPITRETCRQPVSEALDTGGTETVLIVDDVAEQRDVSVELLTSLGYRVNSVGSGQEAVAWLQDNSADIILLDMIMENDFDGLDTYREIVRLHPGQKAVIVSGFSSTERVAATQALGAGPYVKKPFTREAIGRAVREELDRKPAAARS